ncbi:MAG: FMN-binding protein [Ferrimicrobium sp.]
MGKRSITVVGGSVVGFVGIIALYKVSLTSVPTASKISTRSIQSRQLLPTAVTGTPPAPGTVANATGKVINFGYGDLAVKVTTDGSQITDVTVTTLQVLESYSLVVEKVAVPVLRSEVIRGQSARIHAVTGATYTSQAYAASLQSALDRLHIP